MRGVAPAEYVAVTGIVEGVAMPEVIALSGGMVVPTGVVGTGEFEEEAEVVLPAADDDAEDARTAPAFCLFP